jgi:hypothetical protein
MKHYKYNAHQYLKNVETYLLGLSRRTNWRGTMIMAFGSCDATTTGALVAETCATGGVDFFMGSRMDEKIV